MKKWIYLAVICIGLISCKMMLKGAAKYWTKKQVKEFVGNCETHASKLMSDEKAETYCDCAVTKVAEKYTNYEDAKNVGIVEALKVAKDCLNQ